MSGYCYNCGQYYSGHRCTNWECIWADVAEKASKVLEQVIKVSETLLWEFQETLWPLLVMCAQWLGRLLAKALSELLYLSGLYEPCPRCQSLRRAEGTCATCDGRHLARLKRLLVRLGFYHVCANCHGLQPLRRKCSTCASPWPTVRCSNCAYPQVPLYGRCPVCRAQQGWYPFEQVLMFLAACVVLLILVGFLAIMASV